VDRMQVLVGKHQRLIIFSIRFLYGLRIAGPIALGMNSAIRWHTFTSLNAIGAAAWAIIVAGVGYVFGQAIELVLEDLKHYEFLIIALLLLGVLLWHAMWRVKAKA
jgi:membrane protein DedA with SNARE-associated domain